MEATGNIDFIYHKFKLKRKSEKIVIRQKINKISIRIRIIQLNLFLVCELANSTTKWPVKETEKLKHQ
jgi:hypothetical protein